jgi:hypothetical protein
MCHECIQIDQQIIRYQDLTRRVNDDKTIRSIEILIGELAPEKGSASPRARDKMKIALERSSASNWWHARHFFSR